MHNIWLIARREYLERVRTRSFMIMTILTPLLMGGLTVGPGMLAERMSHHSRRLVVVVSDQQMGETIRGQLLHADKESRDTLKRPANRLSRGHLPRRQNSRLILIRAHLPSIGPN